MGTVASVLLLLCWLQLFGPITWGHYAAYFVPFVGLFAHCIVRGGPVRYLAVAAMTLGFVPWRIVPAPDILHFALTRFGLTTAMVLIALIAVVMLLHNDRTPATSILTSLTRCERDDAFGFSRAPA
jgi:hypothetical protein